MKQYVQFDTGATDSGQNDASSISPVENGEAAIAAVFQRPSENLRARTEVVRTELEALKYLADADRGMLLSSPGSATWDGLPIGTFSVTADVTLRPFLAPATSTPATLSTNTNVALTNQVVVATHQLGTSSQKRAYSGANQISIAWVPASGGAFSVVKSGDPDVLYTVTFDSLTTTNSALVSALNGNVTFQNGGLVASLGAGTVGADLVVIPAGEQAQRYLSGAMDAEKHVISASTLNTFAAANPMQEGDVLCIWYDELVSSTPGTYGGRRQSIDEAPENIPPNNGSDIPIGSLFLLRLNPERTVGAIPVCTVANEKLIFANNRVYGPGETGPIETSGSSYQGSLPDVFANGSSLPAASFEDTFDTLVNWLGASGATPGGDRLGVKAIAGSPVSISSGTLSDALNSIITATNTALSTGSGSLTAHITNPTGAHAASAISSIPAGNLASINVQDALNELDSEKPGLTLNNLMTGANTFSGINTFSGASNTFQNSLYAATASGSLCVGTASPASAKLYSTSSTVSPAIQGDNLSSGAGVVGSSVSGIGGSFSATSGSGVAGSGAQYGVAGSSSSATVSEAGVWGRATNLASGVLGSTKSAVTFTSEAAGVVGVGGHVNSGHGVIGVGSTYLGTGVGVVGLSDETVTVPTTPAGVYGAGKGTAHGVVGKSLTVGGYGVYGIGSGTNVGGYFEGGALDGSYGLTSTSLATNGNGLLAFSTGSGVGIYAYAAGSAGLAVSTYPRAGVFGLGGSAGLSSGPGVVGVGGGSGEGLHGIGGPGGGVGVRAEGIGSQRGIQSTGGSPSYPAAGVGGDGALISGGNGAGIGSYSGGYGAWTVGGAGSTGSSGSAGGVGGHGVRSQGGTGGDGGDGPGVGGNGSSGGYGGYFLGAPGGQGGAGGIGSDGYGGPGGYGGYFQGGDGGAGFLSGFAGYGVYAVGGNGRGDANSAGAGVYASAPVGPGIYATATSDAAIRAAKNIDITGGYGVTFDGGNALNAYEEGNWTPQLWVDAVPAYQLGITSSGKYVRVGNLVHAYAAITITSVSGLAGNVYLNNVPFVGSYPATWGGLVAIFAPIAAGGTLGVDLMLEAHQSGGYLTFNSVRVAKTTLSVGNVLYFTGTYRLV